ncbi:MAG: hypothetical protein DRN66_03330 [Candidatus Nanohalarchaeota archaeon]|nr:MAG: hypothetical protein DRN66_03330 [Candidatus Nanohaloarchaeota archaeon]
MDLFSKTIMGGIILYFAFVIATSADIGGGNGFGFLDSIFGSKKIVFFSKDIGPIGSVKPARRIFNLGGDEGINLSAGGKEKRTAIKEIDEMKITHSLFSSQTRTVDFETPGEYKAILIEFNLNATYHSMGDLIINVDNTTIYQSKKKNVRVSFEIPEDIINSSKSHIITINADKSKNIIGKTEYIIKNFRINALKDASEISFPIPLENYEIEGWHQGTIDFVAEEAVRNSPLQIIINNNIIYNQKPLPLEKYELSFSNLQAQMMPKENKIVFSTKTDSSYVLKNIHLSVKYYDTDTISDKMYSFYLDDDDIKTIKKNNVKLNFTIDEITMKRPIKITVNNFTTQVHVYSPQEYTVPLNVSLFLTGMNRISIETNGAYKIGRLNICLDEE